MTAEPNSIVTMKKYYGDRLHVEDQANLYSELMEGNDRSSIITIAAICDSGLEAQIAMKLPRLEECTQQEFEEAFRHDGALGTFSARINMAYYLGVIDAALRGQLNDMRHMRNAVAHTSRRVTFADKELQNVAKRLLAPTGKFKLLEDTEDDFRRAFIAEGMLIFTITMSGRETAIEKVRTSYAAAGKPAPF